MSFQGIGRNGFLLSLLALGMATTANAQQKSRAERCAAKEVALNLEDEPPSMDPTKQVDQISTRFLGHIFEGLMTTDAKQRTVFGTADKHDMSADGLTHTFHIRKAAKWHDGKPVTAHDFVFAMQRLVDPAFASEYSQIAITAQIQNAADVIAKKMPKEKLGVRAIDDSTLEIKLAKPVPFFEALMSFQSFYPVRQDIVKKYGDKFSTTAESIVGNGPFRLAKWVTESDMRLEKATTYWNAKAIKLNAIEAPSLLKDNAAWYNTYITGGYDIVGLGDSERVKLAQKDKLSIKSFNDGSVYYFETNMRAGKVFENKNLRQAIRYGISRKEYVNKILEIPGIKPAFGMVPDYMPGSKQGSTYRKEAPLTWKDGDTATAKKYIQAYLAETKQTKVPSFTILAGDTTRAKKAAEYFQSVFQKLFETEVKIDSVPFKTRLQKMRDAQFDIVMAGWGPDYLDPMTFMDLFLSTNENNRGGFNNPNYDKLIEQASGELDPAKRVKIFQQAENILMDTANVIPSDQTARAYVVAPGLVGVQRAQVGTDPDFRFAEWKSCQ